MNICVERSSLIFVQLYSTHVIGIVKRVENAELVLAPQKFGYNEEKGELILTRDCGQLIHINKDAIIYWHYLESTDPHITSNMFMSQNELEFCKAHPSETDTHFFRLGIIRGKGDFLDT